MAMNRQPDRGNEKGRETGGATRGLGPQDHLRRIEEMAEKRIGDLLVDAGLIDTRQLGHALSIQAHQGGDTVKILISLGYVDVDSFLEFLAEQPGVHKFDLSSCEIDPDLVALVPDDLADRCMLFPIDREGGTLTVGISHPLSDEDMAALTRETGMQIKTLLCSRDHIRAAIDRYYGPGRAVPISAAGIRLLEAPLALSLVARLVRRLDTFPALPETVYRVQDAMENPDSSVRDVAEIVIMDPPIAAKVLSVANSAAYGFARKIEDVTLAVTLLGLRETYTVTLSAAVLNVLEKSKHIDYKRFWLEAVCCAAATRYVAKAAGLRHLTGAFAAGLLHDIGRVALSEVAPALYARIPKAASNLDLVAAEEKHLGISHNEAGYELACYWRLPEELAEPIRYHHTPERAEKSREVVAIVSLADALAQSTGADLESNRPVLSEHRAAFDILGIDIENAEAMVEEFSLRRDESLREAMQ
jgi:HD-like signal output (HDOD) protein